MKRTSFNVTLKKSLPQQSGWFFGGYIYDCRGFDADVFMVALSATFSLSFPLA